MFYEYLTSRNLYEPDATLGRHNLERIKTINSNAIRLLKLVNTLIDFSRIKIGKQNVNYQLTDVAVYKKKLASTFNSLIEKEGLKFEVRVEKIIQPVYVDKQMR